MAMLNNQMVYVGVWKNHDHWCYIMELYPQKYDHGVISQKFLECPWSLGHINLHHSWISKSWGEPSKTNLQSSRPWDLSNCFLLPHFTETKNIQKWYPLVNSDSYWKWPVEIVDLPINSMVDLSIVFCMFTRGYLISSSFLGHNGYHQQPLSWKRRPRSLRSSSVAHRSPSQASGVPRGLNLDWKTTSQSDPWNDNEYIRGITLW